MTDITERLAEIEARVEAATEGPWRFEPEGESHCGEPQCCSEYWDNRIWGADRVLAESHMLSEADAEFVAHARTDVPWLVEQVRQRIEAEDRIARAWGPSEARRVAESQALRMWPETVHLGKWDGLLSKDEIDTRLLIQRRAYVMGERAAWERQQIRAALDGDGR